MTDWFTTPLLTAALTSLVVMAGWYVAYRNARKLDESRRLEKVIDFQTALIAEIKTNITRFANTNFADHARDMRKLILSARRAYTPFVPRYAGTVVFDQVLREIHILPNDTIQDVIAYYKQEYVLKDFVEDLRSESFARLDKKRKADLYVEFIRNIKDAQTQGNLAITAMRQDIAKRKK